MSNHTDKNLIVFSYTLEKVYSVRELVSILEAKNFPLCFIQPKYDGVAVFVEYVNGVPISIKTKNTEFKNLKILSRFGSKNRDFNGNIRGEIYLNNNLFEEKYKHKYETNRTATVGLINGGEIDDLEFVVYDLDSSESFIAKMETLKSLGLQTGEYVSFDTKLIDSIGITGLEEKFNFFIDEQKNRGFPIDGLVTTSNNPLIEIDKYTSNNRIAYKKIQKSFDVQIERIVEIPNRFGNLTRIAYFKTIEYKGNILCSVNIGRDPVEKGGFIKIGVTDGQSNAILIN